MYITYKIIHFSPNFVGIRMPTSGMISKLPNDLKLLLMAVCRYLFVLSSRLPSFNYYFLGKR